jgi:hypothetical protein
VKGRKKRGRRDMELIVEIIMETIVEIIMETIVEIILEILVEIIVVADNNGNNHDIIVEIMIEMS